MATMKVSIIPNDLTQDLEKVFQMCKEENVKYVELASMWEKSILDLNQEEEERVKDLLKKYGIKVASIQTQIMKVHPPGSPREKPGSKSMHDDFEYNISQLDRAIELAQIFDAKYIICYGFMDRNQGDTKKYWDIMIKIYKDFVLKLKPANKTMVIEADGGQYIGTIDDYMKLLTSVNSEHVQANFDMANLYHMQEFTREEFERFYKYVPYFHVKDRKLNTGIKKFLFGGNKPALTGEGNIPWRQVLPWFAEKGFDGFLSVEPHVGGDRFTKGRQCVKNLQKMLKELNIDFE
jgi:sugar phosphate isomerase/epimerase